MYLILVFFLLFFSVAFFYMNTQDMNFPQDVNLEGFTSNFQEMLPITIAGDNKSIQVPNNISGNIEPYISFGGDIRIPRFKVIEFAKEQTKEPNAGKIGWSVPGHGDSLSILGASPNNTANWNNDRTVKVWDILEVNNSVRVNQKVTCQTMDITSDKRVKHKNKALSSKTSLDQVRSLIPTQFEYKTGTTPVQGFIAQEVHAVLPACVSRQKSYITNIYDTASVKGSILTFKHFNTNDLAYKGKDLFSNLKLVTKQEELYVSIVRIVDEHTLEIDKEYHMELLVYGQEVDDFLTIDKNQLFTLTTSALQELDKQLQEERDKNQTVLHRILQRVSALEAK